MGTPRYVCSQRKSPLRLSRSVILTRRSGESKFDKQNAIVGIPRLGPPETGVVSYSMIAFDNLVATAVPEKNVRH